MYRHESHNLRGPISQSYLRRSVDHETNELIEEDPTSDYEAEFEEEEIRIDLVARVRREIAEGTYEDESKLAYALDVLLERSAML